MRCISAARMTRVVLLLGVAAAGSPAQTPSCPGEWVDGMGALDALRADGGPGFVNGVASYSPPFATTPLFVVGGEFVSVGGVAVNNVAGWDGTTWAPLGDGLLGPVGALAVFQGQLYAAGDFGWTVIEAGGQSKHEYRFLARFVAGTQTWHYVDADSAGGSTIFDLEVLGETLWIAGIVAPFTSGGLSFGGNLVGYGAGGFVSVSATFVAPSGEPSRIAALEPWDRDGAGPRPLELVCGGNFVSVVVNGTPIAGTQCVVRLNPTTGVFASLAGGIAEPYSGGPYGGLGTGSVDALQASTLAGPPTLYVGGSFGAVGAAPSMPASNIAKVTGPVLAWHAMGFGTGAGAEGTSGPVLAMSEYFDGCGSVLAVAGAFTDVGDAVVNGIARYDGAVWTGFPVGFGAGFQIGTEVARRLHAAGPSLWVAGLFGGVIAPSGFVESASLALWRP
jgi:hypothetical protein